jgi:hypothetical protein
MARVVRKATVGSPDPSFTGTAEPNTTIAALGALITTAQTHAATLVADNPAVTPVENAVATLEGDGATPTQAHVTALRNVWDTLSAAVTTHNSDANTVNTDVTALSTTASLATVSGDVVVIVNLANVTTRKKLTDALLGILNQLRDGTSSFPA